MKTSISNEKDYQKKLKSGKMKYIKKYIVEMDLKTKLNSKDSEELICDILKDYFLEGSILKIKETKMTKEEVENWEDFDEEDEDE